MIEVTRLEEAGRRPLKGYTFLFDSYEWERERKNGPEVEARLEEAGAEVNYNWKDRVLDKRRADKTILVFDEEAMEVGADFYELFHSIGIDPGDRWDPRPWSPAPLAILDVKWFDRWFEDGDFTERSLMKVLKSRGVMDVLDQLTGNELYGLFLEPGVIHGEI